MSHEPSVTIQDPPTPSTATVSAGCPAHPTGHLNCRACGTTPRQLAAAAERRKAEQRRLVDQAASRRSRQERAERRVRDTASVEQNIALAKAAIEQSKHTNAGARGDRR